MTMGREVVEVLSPERRSSPLTIEMIRAGMNVLRRWDPNEDEPEALVTAIYLEMAAAGLNGR